MKSSHGQRIPHAVQNMGSRNFLDICHSLLLLAAHEALKATHKKCGSPARFLNHNESAVRDRLLRYHPPASRNSGTGTGHVDRA
jgi:hypothetical protein